MLEILKRKKVDKQDKQMPQSIEQLIEHYDLEKLWPYIEKIASHVNVNIEGIEDIEKNGVVSGDTVPIGAIAELPSNIIPENWLLCDGREISRKDYSELFEVLGTTCGEGDGSTTFNLPDMRTRVPAGYLEGDDYFGELGGLIGNRTQALRALIGATHASTNRIGYEAAGRVPGHGYSYSLAGGDVISGIAEGNINHSTAVTDSNGNTPTTVQPTIIVNFIIKAKQSAGLVATVVNSLESESEVDGLSAKQGKVLKEMIEGTVLYENEAGIAEGSFEVNKDGYNRLRFYDTGGQFLGEITTDATVANLGLVYQGSSNLYLYGCRLFIDGNTFTVYSNKRNIFNGSSWSVDTDLSTVIHIGKVKGYR